MNSESRLDFEDRPGSLATGQLKEKTPECPDESVWFEVAGGTLAEAREAELLEHAATCAWCAAELKQTIADFDDETTESECGVLESIAPAGIRLVATEGMAAAPARPATRVRANPWRWAIAAALAAAALTGVWEWGYPRWENRRAEKLLAETRLPSRPTTFRLADVPWAPARVTRGTGAEQPLELREADEAASRGAGAGAALTRARIELAWTASRSAADQIESAMKELGKSPEILNDLGVARAEWSRPDAGEGAQVLGIFDEALQMRPGYPPALFNRALWLQAMGRMPEACQAVNAFTTAEPGTEWATELKQRIACGP